MVKSQTINEYISNLVKSSINKAVLNMQEDRSSEIHVTDLTTCIRRSYFEKVYGRKINYPNSLFILRGILVHEAILEQLAKELKANYEIEIEYKGIKGRIDLLTEKEVIEIKTINKVPIFPYSGHLEQLNFYCFASDRDVGILVYVGIADGKVISFEHYANREMLDKTLEKFVKLKESLEQLVPPSSNLDLVSRKIFCPNCPYRDKCEEEVVWYD